LAKVQESVQTIAYVKAKDSVNEALTQTWDTTLTLVII
jgi:hypothetical protein